MCMCTFDDECSGTGVVYCSPPCGGDQCICVCGGEAQCEGCDACDSDVDYPLDSFELDEEEGDHLP